VLGNSLGGVGAIRYALARPELVAGLVLISPGGAPMSEAELAELLSLFDMRTEADGRRFMQRVLADPEAWGSSVLAWGARQRVSRRGVMALIQRIRREDLLSAEELGQLRAPALLIWGQEERILPERHCQFFEEHLPPGTRVEKPAGMGHSPMLDVPEALSERVLAFARTLG
jgi:pimeloyl-ACP methyl ester carboxylesterase